VARRVFIHVGLPKTATTYLQTILWASRDQLRAEGLLLPGQERRDHLWASRVVREDPNLERQPERHGTAWARLRRELGEWEGDGLVSHEFFAAASRKQARAMVEALPSPDVHVIVTAREPLGLFAASWQESLKNGETVPLADYARQVSKSSNAIWNWRTLDLRLVLERWGVAVPPERIHVLVLDPSAPQEDVWNRFAGIVGFDPGTCDLSGSFPNSSMGVVEAETLRRVNTRLEGFTKGFDKGVFLRSYLADERLVPRRGERFWPEPDQIEDCRQRGRDAVSHLAAGSYDVVGNLEHLLVPEHLEERRVPASVTDTEVADVAVDLVAVMLGDVRRLRRRARADDGAAPRLRSLARRLRRG
jgi:hypothetical protein